MQFNDGTYEVIGCAMKVHRKLGPGLREKPYENAMMIALRKAEIQGDQQRPYPIHYDGEIVGDCVPDITAGEILIDAKSIPAIGDSEVSQMLNYLRISKKEVGLIINFRNEQLEWKRIIL